MNHEVLAEADRIVATLSPGRREATREIVVNALHRGYLDDNARRFLIAATKSTFLADVLTEALSESLAPPEADG
ncbi:hypothetical protein N1027_18830 [Herbiconiux sp. CPCC 205763]|uniref:ANTAR domain-containing protein n=1 Tax=Herbiconiux aconitum TaxID=2970913 RepID=A0ABT2GVE8_9MICO|nr:hypothetical protein [Herbiconiux aconitum]MCS5720192.1 hypothetical protein [Herbiconiux aconitum]